jgi:DNA-binding SARP family transcriptional activator
MDFQILGPVELQAHEGWVNLGPLKQRTVLAALLFDAGRPVTLELLISRVWDGCPPAEVRNTLYTYVARLRRILASVPGAEGARLVRRSGGYLLDVDPGTVDAHRFTRLAADARATGVSEEQRYALASRALAEFAAAPLTDLTCQWAGGVREMLVRRQRDMLRLHATLAIRLGHAVLVVDRLHGVMVEQPLAEEMAGILMSALYFSGRSAEALGLFARTRAAIAAELGVEPGPELCRTHEEILRGELTRPALGALTERPSYLAQPGVPELPGEDPAAQSRPAAPVPSLPPADRRARTGSARANGAAERTVVAEPARAPAPTEAAVVALVGPDDLEKSVPAIRIAQQIRAAYLDGQLSADHTAWPADAASVSGRRPRSGGTAPEPRSEPARRLAELYRGLLARGKILVVLYGSEGEPVVAVLPPQRPSTFGSRPSAGTARVTASGRRCGPPGAPPAAARRAQSPTGRRSPLPATRHVPRGPGQARPGLPR